MELDELASLIDSERANAIGHHSGDLAEQRALELQYYNSEPFGNERANESQVVSSDVFDTVEGLLPDILDIFTSSDQVVRFDAEGPEDEEAAAQRTDTVNYVFYRQNNGFIVLYEWFKDALIQKNGVVKYYYEDKESTTKEKYEGLTEGEYLKLMQGSGYSEIEVLSHEEYPDEAAAKQKEQALAGALAKLEASPLPPAQKRQMAAQLTADFARIPVPNLHDVEARFKKDESKVCVETVPPEEFRISRKQRCISIQDTTFCSHETKKTISELRDMGCPEDILAESGPSENNQDTGSEQMARDRFLDETPVQSPDTDPSQSERDVSDGYIRVDFDGDGIAELRHFIKVGRRVWVNDECDHICFAALTPIIMPHRWIGLSVAELVMQDQFTKSTIWRQMLNNLYLSNNPTKVVLSSASGVPQANLDDLMNSAPGAIRREYVPGAIRNDETPWVAAQSMPMLQYIDQQKEVRTGQTRYNQGTDSDSLNKTARGIQMIQAAGHKRARLIARIFAETGVADLMRGIAYQLSKYSSRALTIKLRNKWVDVDPREWKHQYNMTIDVGLGTGSRDAQLAHLQGVHQSQIELMQTGRGYMVSDENVYNLHKKKSELLGFKHPEIFISDPASVQKPPQQPNPDVLKIQADAQTDAAKIQSSERQTVFDAQLQKDLETIRGQVAITIAHIDAATKKEIAGIQAKTDAELEVFKQTNKLDGEARDLEVKKLGVDYSEALLTIKKQLDDLGNKERELVTAQNDGRLSEHTGALMKQVMEAGGSVANQIQGIVAGLDNVLKAVAQQSQATKAAADEKLKPKVMKIKNVKTDDKGVITSAEVDVRPSA